MAQVRHSDGLFDSLVSRSFSEIVAPPFLTGFGYIQAGH
jgi:hypothetical protein